MRSRGAAVTVTGTATFTGVVLAVLCSAIDAHAYCRKTTCDPDKFECALDEHGCPTLGAALHWDFGRPIAYRFHAGASSEARRAIRSAFVRWTEVACSSGGRTSLRFEESADAATDEEDGEEMDPFAIYFRSRGPLGEDTLALTTHDHGAATGRIAKANIEINAESFLDQRGMGDNGIIAIDLEAVVTHEVGHYIGLAHSDDPRSIMVPRYCDGASRSIRCAPGHGAVERRRLSEDDEHAVCALYPPTPKTTNDYGEVPPAPACNLSFSSARHYGVEHGGGPRWSTLALVTIFLLRRRRVCRPLNRELTRIRMAGGPPKISESIERALVELEAQNFDGVIEHLLVAWRRSRSKILAEAIDALSAKVAEGVAPIEGRTYALRHAAWLGREKTRRQAEVPMLLESIAVHDVEETTAEVKRVLAWEPDPRVTMPLVLVMAKASKFPLMKSERLMELLASVLQQHLDPRLLEPMMNRRTDWRMRIKASGVIQLAQRVEQDYPLTETDEVAIARARDLILTPFKQNKEAAALDVDALYQAVYDDPEDDGARAVLSDALLQASSGDGRGQLIALTMGKSAESKKAQQKAKAILERHRDEFVGTLKPYLKHPRFERGFLASAIIGNPVWSEERREWTHVLPKEVHTDRTWLTTHTLYFADVENMDVVFELVNNPKMRALRTFGLAGTLIRPLTSSVNQLMKLHQMGVVLPERIDRFHLCGPEPRYNTTDYQSTGFDPQQVEAIAAASTQVLQHIKHLEIHAQGPSYAGDPRPAHFDWLWDLDLGKRIEDLTLVVKKKGYAFDPWITRDTQRPLPVKRIVFVTEHFGDGPRIVLHRGEEGKRLRSFECTNMDAEAFRSIAASVRRYDQRIDELVFHGRAPVPSVRKDLDEAVAAARLKPKKLVFSGAGYS